jgi:hypothetical protein
MVWQIKKVKWTKKKKNTKTILSFLFCLTHFSLLPLKWRGSHSKREWLIYKVDHGDFTGRARERHHEKQKTQLSHELGFISDFHLLCNLLSGKLISREPALLLLYSREFL